MLLLVSELVFGTWRFSASACTSYLIFDSLNKFTAPIIVFLISRTCYATVCLNKKYQQRAASLKVYIQELTKNLLPAPLQQAFWILVRRSTSISGYDFGDVHSMACLRL